MRSLLLLPLPLALSVIPVPVSAQQCPSSALRVEVVAGSIGGCVTVAPADDVPELNVTNNCNDDQLNLSAGVDCPNCGPPLTLRPGNFGAFIVDTRPLTLFDPTSPSEDHVLNWALGSSTGTLTVRVDPDITICPIPDMGMPDMMMIDEADPDSVPEGQGGCSSVSAESGWLLFVPLLLAARGGRRRDNQE